MEDVSDDAVMVRHDKCELEEKKKFMSYLKIPLGYGRSRSHKRTDSRAESSGANTPDPLSPHMGGENVENTSSPMTSPPATPLPMNNEDSGSLPSISMLRRRTMSQSRWTKEKELTKEETRCNSPEHVEVAPYDKRDFPLSDNIYDMMVKQMPDTYNKYKTKSKSHEDSDIPSVVSDMDEKLDFHDSESTESAYGDEDPNDPEWIDMERVKDRYKR